MDKKYKAGSRPGETSNPSGETHHHGGGESLSAEWRSERVGQVGFGRDVLGPPGHRVLIRPPSSPQSLEVRIGCRRWDLSGLCMGGGGGAPAGSRLEQGGSPVWLQGWEGQRPLRGLLSLGLFRVWFPVCEGGRGTAQHGP